MLIVMVGLASPVNPVNKKGRNWHLVGLFLVVPKFGTERWKDMKVDMVADLEVYKVADMEVEMVANM